MNRMDRIKPLMTGCRVKLKASRLVFDLIRLDPLYPSKIKDFDLC
jgi:hypothetical protein